MVFVLHGSGISRAAGVQPVPAPDRTVSLVRDMCSNYWALVESRGAQRLMVRPAQAPLAWQEITMAEWSSDTWTSLALDDDGKMTVKGQRSAFTFDPRFPAERSRVHRTDPLTPIATSWRTVAAMPASNHDISGAVLEGRLYVAGGATEDWGLPRRPRIFDEIWALDPTGWTWSIVARLSRPRIFGATAAFDGRVWTLGGQVPDGAGKRIATAAVEIYDPATGQVSAGTDLPVVHPAPVALVARGRLYVVGTSAPHLPARVDSIGEGESTWRREPDGPVNMWALAGAVLADQLYFAVPQKGLVRFDPTSGVWSAIPGPSQPRSPQMAAWRGEIWLIGGRDISDQTETRIYDPEGRRWRSGPPLPRASAWGAAAVLADRLIVTGGAKGPAYSYSDRTYALSPEDARSVGGKAADAVSREPATRWAGFGAADRESRGYPFTTVRVFPRLRFRRPVTISTVPRLSPAGEKRLLVIESDGVVATFPNEPDPAQADVMLDLPKHFKAATQTYGLAFHPRFPEVPEVFVVYNRMQPKPAYNVLAKFRVTQFAPLRADPASEVTLMRWPSDGHNGGDVKFGPDGYLYVSTGDGGPPGDPRDFGQRVDLVTGGVLRVDVDRRDLGKPYAIPPDNPFVGQPGVLPEYWAYGLRNPWRMSFAPTGELWAGDNGDDRWESVHLIQRGHNYGWSVYEGSHPFKTNGRLGRPTLTVTKPIVELPHSEARSVIGGLVYRGKQLPDLDGHYVFGDYVTGSLWAFRWDGNSARELRRIAENCGRPIGFGEDPSGEILIARLDGEIHRVVAAAADAVSLAVRFPRRLSETGLFARMRDLAPSPGVVPYEINAGLWSDGARVRRMLALPAANSIQVGVGDDRWHLPEGAAVARTLEFGTASGARRVETQVLLQSGGEPRFATYAWNAEQTDATLVDDGGEVRDTPGLPTRRWEYASRITCAVCHGAEGGGALGLSMGQLNCLVNDAAHDDHTENQIEKLSREGVITRSGPITTGQLPQRADPFFPSSSLEARARAYLAVNCGHCHRPNGPAGRAAFCVNETLPLADTGLLEVTPLVPLLGAGSKLIAAGRPERSELLHRLQLKIGGRMPLLGSERVDEAGVELLRAWILGLGAGPHSVGQNDESVNANLRAP